MTTNLLPYSQRTQYFSVSSLFLLLLWFSALPQNLQPGWQESAQHPLLLSAESVAISQQQFPERDPSSLMHSRYFVGFRTASVFFLLPCLALAYCSFPQICDQPLLTASRLLSTSAPPASESGHHADRAWVTAQRPCTALITAPVIGQVTMQSLGHRPGHCVEPGSQPGDYAEAGSQPGHCAEPGSQPKTPCRPWVTAWRLCRAWVTAQITVQSLEHSPDHHAYPGHILETMQSLDHSQVTVQNLDHSPDHYADPGSQPETMQSLGHSPGHGASAWITAWRLCGAWVTAKVTRQILSHSLETMQSLDHSPGHCADPGSQPGDYAEPGSQPRSPCRAWVTVKLPQGPLRWCVLSLTSYVLYAYILSCRRASDQTKALARTPVSSATRLVFPPQVRPISLCLLSCLLSSYSLITHLPLVI